MRPRALGGCFTQTIWAETGEFKISASILPIRDWFRLFPIWKQKALNYLYALQELIFTGTWSRNFFIHRMEPKITNLWEYGIIGFMIQGLLGILRPWLWEPIMAFI